MLTLKDFVFETLSQVTEALVEFEKKGKEFDLEITPFPYVQAMSDKIGDHGFLKGAVATGRSGEPWKYNIIAPIEFDVAVTATSENATKVGAGIRVLEMFTAGGDEQNRYQNNSVSRVHFKVPLQLPMREK